MEAVCVLLSAALVLAMIDMWLRYQHKDTYSWVEQVKDDRCGHPSSLSIILQDGSIVMRIKFPCV